MVNSSATASGRYARQNQEETRGPALP